MPTIKAEVSKPQVLIQPNIFESRPELDESSTKPAPARVRTLRKHPTIALARMLVTAPVLMSEWSFGEKKDKAPVGARDKIEEILIPARTHLLKTGLLGSIDFGYAPFEKVFGLDDEGFQIIAKYKALLQDYTTILVDKKGRFKGLHQEIDGEEYDIPLSKSLSLSTDIEGTDWYGQSVMEILDTTYTNWDGVNKAADRFDSKIAGAHWVVHYPEGMTEVNGVETANDEIAADILAALQASSKIAVPNRIQDTVDDMNKDAPRAWRIELISANASIHTTFLDRLKYLDALLVRAFGFPERAILEGRFGTKAEAETHGDLGILNIEVKHQTLVNQLNWHVVNQLLRLNYGEQAANTVFIETAPIVDARLSILKEILSRVLQNNDLAINVVNKLDLKTLIEEIGLPLSETGEELEDTEDTEEGDDDGIPR